MLSNSIEFRNLNFFFWQYRTHKSHDWNGRGEKNQTIDKGWRSVVHPHFSDVSPVVPLRRHRPCRGGRESSCAGDLRFRDRFRPARLRPWPPGLVSPPLFVCVYRWPPFGGCQLLPYTLQWRWCLHSLLERDFLAFFSACSRCMFDTCPFAFLTYFDSWLFCISFCSMSLTLCWWVTYPDV